MNPFASFSRDIDENTLEIQESILIICEGEKTEPNYFINFEAFGLEVKVKGTGKNTESLVEFASQYINEYDEVWCVFDKDSFSSEQFNNACQNAENLKMKLAYSNESFELWYLLHFYFYDHQIGREAYISKLDKIFKSKFKKGYLKNSEDTYTLLKKKQDDAIKNAKKLESIQDIPGSTPSSQSPVTKVHHLVEKLNKNSREKRWNRKEVRYLQATIESVNAKEIIVISEMDAYEPENFKQNDRIKLNFDTEVVDLIDTPDLIGNAITVNYSSIEELHNGYEINMEYPNNAKVNGVSIFNY